MKKFINKLSFWLTVLMVSLFSCEQEDLSLSELQGTIRFGGISLEFAPMGSPGSRITGNSTWVHVFPNTADLVFENKASGQQYVLGYNPNDFSVPYSITLPYGAYDYYSIVEGGIFSDYLPFEARGAFILGSQSLEISLEAETGYGLLTVKDRYVEKASVSDGDRESDLVQHQDGDYWYMYVKGGTAATLKIMESFGGSTILRELTILANRHYNFILKLNEGAAAITDLILAVFELEEEEILLGSSSKFYLHENGITCMCPDTEPGEKGFINGVEYESVNNVFFRKRRFERVDFNKLCTSLVDDMSNLFNRDIEGDSTFPIPVNIGSWDVSNVTTMRGMFHASFFNEPIGDWDVGNVTDMRFMFTYAPFNQPIGKWDVGNVTNMAYMFEATPFNQPIGDWNVSNVTNMEYMFIEALMFNQPIGDWDVSKVTNMEGMFTATSFNQPIGNWDVGSVINMRFMFSSSSFNQPIGNWDVGSVINMGNMFSTSSFNQPIGNWNVSSVTSMRGMFRVSAFKQPIGNWDVSNVTNMDVMFSESLFFNQDLTSWCVQNIQVEPREFSRGSALLPDYTPEWGTCPN